MSTQDNENEFAPMADEDLLHELTLALVDNTREVKITSQEDERGKLLVIHCSVDDRNKIIGSGGCNIKSIQRLFRSIAAFDGRRISVALANRSREMQD